MYGYGKILVHYRMNQLQHRRFIMNEKIRQLKEIIDGTDNLVFSEEREFLQKVVFLILEVPMDFIV